jgi:leucyl aminopeptidase
MQIKLQSGDISQVQADAIVVNLFEGITVPGGGTGAVDRALDGAISRVIADGDCRGKEGEVTLIHTLGKLPAPRVVVAGLGKAEKFSLDKVRSTSAGVVRYLRRLRCEKAATITHGAGIAGLDAEACAQAIAEGTLMGLYQFKRHKKADEDAKEFTELTLVEHDSGKLGALERGVERGTALADAANFARDLANEPSNVLTPTELAARATAWAKDAGLEAEVFDKAWMEERKMGALLGVAQGSEQPPKFIVIRYKGGGSTHLALVGKGITFDTGGISIKPAAGMEEMKGDMTGAASVIAAVGAIARLKPAINVTAIAPCTENMPSGTAIKPGDVLYAMTGTTIEVLNTDAEGRLILADGLGYAVEQKPDAIIDVATLTGAISIALGNVAMGAMTNSQPLYQRVQSAAEASGEKVWELPMFDEYKEQIKSEVADIKNTGGRGAGSITAAFFLKEFVGDTPWVHLDIAGVDFFEKEKGVIVKGASGIPVRTLVNLALELAQNPL